MSPPEKNLLEAFKSAGDAGPTEPASSGGGPFAGDSNGNGGNGGDEPPSSGSLEAPRPLPAWIPIVVALIVSFVLGIAVGRKSMDQVAAQGDGGASDVDRNFTPTGAQPRAGISRGDDRPGGDERRTTPQELDPVPTRTALDDPANLYTVVVATYSKSQIETAWRAHDHLKSKGLPVFAPVDQRRHIVVLAGAAPDRASLTSIEQRIHALDGPDGERGAFSDAYTDRIDKHR